MTAARFAVSNDGFNRTPHWRSLIIVPVSTSQGQARRGPTVVHLPAGAGGLPSASVAICHQVTTLDRGKMREQLGTLPSGFVSAVDRALKAALDLE